MACTLPNIWHFRASVSQRELELKVMKKQWFLPSVSQRESKKSGSDPTLEGLVRF